MCVICLLQKILFCILKRKSKCGTEDWTVVVSDDLALDSTSSMTSNSKEAKQCWELTKYKTE